MIISLGGSSCCTRKTAGKQRETEVLGMADGLIVTHFCCEGARSRIISIKSNVNKSDFVRKGMILIRRNVYRSFVKLIIVPDVC
jgi:hypothetical protein